MNYLYGIRKKYYGETIKIGSTCHFPARMRAYITPEPDFCDDSHEIWLFEIKESKWSCYQLDKIIQYSSKKYGIPYIKYQNDKGGGTEHYLYDSIENLCMFLDKIGVVYVKTDVSVDKLIRDLCVNDHNDYDEILDKNAKKNLNIDPVIMTEIDTIFEKPLFILRNWQSEYNSCLTRFLRSDDMTGNVVSPTGSGKSFMMILTALLYMQNYKKDVIITTQLKEIMYGSKNDVRNKHKNFYLSGIVKIKPYEVEVINHTDGDTKKDILINKSSKRRIHIFNNTKFISSKEFKNYAMLDFRSIGLLLLDECHWSGARKLYDFLLYIKTNTKIKMIGYSATPCRTQESNKDNTMTIFGDGNELNMIYERSYIACIDDGDIVPVKWGSFNVTIADLEEVEYEKKDHTKIHYHRLSEQGMRTVLTRINDIYFNPEHASRSVYNKGIWWSRTVQSLLKLYKHIMDNKHKYPHFKDITFYCTFSDVSKYQNEIKTVGLTDADIHNGIANFKSADKNAILLAVNRGCEGFDDPKSDFGVKLYIVNDADPLPESQRMGRFSRTYTGKTHGTYITLETTDIDIMKTNLIERLASWISFLNSYNSISKYYQMKSDDERKIVKLEHVCNVGQYSEIDVSALKDLIRERMMKINNTNKFKNIIKKLKAMDVFDINCDFWKVYESIEDKELHGLPKDEEDMMLKFGDILNHKSWYDILGYDTSIWYNNIEKCKRVLKGLYRGTITEKIYHKLRHNDPKLPLHPKFLYHKYFFTFDTTFNDSVDMY